MRTNSKILCIFLYLLNHVLFQFFSLLCKMFLISVLLFKSLYSPLNKTVQRRSSGLPLCPDVIILNLVLPFHSNVSKLSFQAGDPILIYFDSLSILSVLKQPVKMGVSGLCVDGNPAG